MRTMLCLIILSFSAFAGTDAQVKKIDKLMSAYHAYDQFNGSVLVAKKGKVIYKKGFGLANVEWDIANTPDTRFRLASITKQFTAMVIMQLVQEGKLKLDGTISDYLDYYRKDTGQKITIHHLLTHTPGIPSYTDDPDFMRNQTRKSMEVTPFVKEYCSGDFLTEPGETYAYNNSGYCILGAIIEAVTDMSYEDAVAQYIFKPLGMDQSGYDHYETVIPKRATGYNQRGSEFSHAQFIDMSLPYAAGSLYSSIEDLYKWDRALYTDQLLSQKNLAKMMTDHINNYGYGFQIFSLDLSDKRQKKVVAHGGGIFGFRTYIMRLVDDEHLVVLLCNGSRPNGAERQIANILYDLPFEMPKKSVAREVMPLIQKGELDQAIAQAKSLAQNDGYQLSEGEINGMGYQLLGRKQINQAIDMFKLNTILFPKSSNTYDSLGEAYKEAGNRELTIANYKKAYAMDPANTNAKAVLEEMGVDVKALEPAEIKVPREILETYVGTYELSPQFKVTFFIEDDQFMTQATGQSKFPIFAQSETRFFLKVVSGQVEFNKNADGKVDSVTLFQGGREIKGKKVE